MLFCYLLGQNILWTFEHIVASRDIKYCILHNIIWLQRKLPGSQKRKYLLQLCCAQSYIVKFQNCYEFIGHHCRKQLLMGGGQIVLKTIEKTIHLMKCLWRSTTVFKIIWAWAPLPQIPMGLHCTENMEWEDSIAYFILTWYLKNHLHERKTSKLNTLSCS